ncbi:40S ribosomal protein SA [Manis javanica]|nr:40S ribosomal protein SA [Manis javanica]
MSWERLLLAARATAAIENLAHVSVISSRNNGQLQRATEDWSVAPTAQAPERVVLNFSQAKKRPPPPRQWHWSLL